MFNHCKHNHGAVYNHTLNQWSCANCGKIIKPTEEQTKFKQAVDNSSITAKKCECGGDAVKSTHTRWCPKYGI